MTEQATNPHAEIASLREQRMAGAITQEAFLSRMETLGPAAASMPAAGPKSAPDASQAAETLRRDRVAGKIGEREFHERMAQLGPATTGEAGPVLFGDAVERDLAAAMAAPEHPGGYTFTASGSDAEALELDSQVREAFHAAGVPNSIASAVVSQVERLAAREAPERFISESRDRLRATWGESFDERVAAIDAWIDSQPKLRAIADRFVDAGLGHVLADPIVLSQLDALVSYRSRRV